jgi:hypothetical protein
LWYNIGIGMTGKLQFMRNEEYEGLCPCPPHKGLLKKSLMNPQNFQKA